MNFLLLPIMVLKLFVLVFCIPFIALYLTYLRHFCKITLFLRNDQEKSKNSASYQRNTRNLRNPQTGQVKICVICEICVTFIQPHRQKNLWESVISVGPSFKIAKCGRTYPKAPYKLLYPVFNNNTVKSSYMLNVFCNHNHIIYNSSSANDNVCIFNKLTFFTEKSLLITQT